MKSVLKWVGIFVLGLSLSTNIWLSLYLKKYKESIDIDKKYYNDDVFILQNKIIDQIEVSKDRISMNMLIHDENKKAIRLADLIIKPTLILRFSEKHCESCIISILSKLAEFSKATKLENIVVLTTYSNMPHLNLIKEKYNYSGQIFNLPNEYLDEIDSEKFTSPYFFILNNDGIQSMIFCPEKNMPIITNMYFDKIKTYLKL